jgi:hypothetical protein
MLLLVLLMCASLSGANPTMSYTEYLQHWVALPVDREVQAHTAVDTPESFISPILEGDFAQQLYQLAAAHVIAKARNVRCIVSWGPGDQAAWWSKRGVSGGFRRPANITLKHIFPSVVLSNIEARKPSLNDTQLCFCWPLNSSLPYIHAPLSGQGEEHALWVHGLFMHSEYFHADRDYLVHHVFSFNPVMLRYIKSRLSSLLVNGAELVSFYIPVHLTPDEQLAASSWYLRVLEAAFDHEKVIFMVFSEETDRLMPLLSHAQALVPKLRFVILNEDFATTLAMMNICQHHIVAESALSFWGLRTSFMIDDYNNTTFSIFL